MAVEPDPVAVRAGHGAGLCARSVGQSAGQARLEPPGRRLDHSRRLRARARASAPAHRAGAGKAARRFHRQRTGLRAAPAKPGQRSQPSVAEAVRRRQSQRRRPLGQRSDEPGDGLCDHGARLAVDQGTNADLDFLAGDHHAGGGVLSDLRLGQDGERGRQPDPAAAARHRAQPRPRHRRDHLGLCARTIRRLPDPRFLLCRRADACGIELRPAHRRRFRTDQFHPLCGIADRRSCSRSPSRWRNSSRNGRRS